MNKIAVITDTDCSLPLELTQRLGIVQVPIIIQFGNESYRAVYDIDDAATFARIDRQGRIPTTAAPAPGQFAEAYQAAFEGGAEAILCFTISSTMSATFQAASTAREMFPDKDIRVIDTHTLALAQGFMVLAAAEALEKGASLEEALTTAQNVRDRTHLFAALATLKYLAMSGRVGHLAAGLASLLEVKPILTVKDGQLQLLEKVRTQRKAWARTIELAAEAAGHRPIERIGYLHVNARQMAEEFAAQVAEVLPCPADPIYTDMTPGLSVHSGAGLVGVVFTTPPPAVHFPEPNQGSNLFEGLA